MCYTLVLVVAVFLAAMPAGAQEDEACPALVEQAVQAAAESCAGLVPGQVCYGYTGVEVSVYEGQDAPTLDATNNVASLSSLAGVATTAADLDAGTWGIAVLAAEFGGPTATFVLMGDASMLGIGPLPEPAAPGVETVTGVANARANLRAGPSTQSAVAVTLDINTSVEIMSTDANVEWYQVRAAGSGREGWVWGELITVTDTEALANLPVFGMEPELVVSAGAGFLEAFDFTAPSDAPVCSEAGDALVVQSEGQVTFSINGLIVTLDGTAAFVHGQGPADEDLLAVLLVDGEFSTTINNFGVLVGEPGRVLGVSLDDGGALGAGSDILAPGTETAGDVLQSACANASAVLPGVIDCPGGVVYLHKITALNDLDWPVVLWIDAETQVLFDAGETTTFLVPNGERTFQVCNEGAQPGDAECGTAISGPVDGNKVWDDGWRPEL
jgi:uncharacterized protein YgiM (DUF1202 family)